MTYIGDKARIRLELRDEIAASMTGTERLAAEAWLRDCESVLQREADRTEVRTLPDGSVVSFIRKPDGQ